MGLTMDCLLKMEKITKTFPGVVALDNVSIDIFPSEVHALVGENGAGKSTLMKIMNGVYQPDSGRIIVNGKEEVISGTQKAQSLGISIVFQEFNLCNDLDVANNIFIGRIKNRYGITDDKWLYSETQKVLDQLKRCVNPRAKVHSLSIAEKQMVEIAKAVSTNAKVIVFDEPTSALTDREIERLFEIIGILKENGCGIFYISHRMEELEQIADRVTVLRDGKHIATMPFQDVSMDKLIAMMVGRALTDKFPVHKRNIGEIYFTAKNIYQKGKLDVKELYLRKGEILGVAGLVGSGRTETMRAIFGADQSDHIELTLDGAKIVIHSPKDAVKHGIAYLTEDRKENGLALSMSVLQNISMASHSLFARWHFLMDSTAEKENALHFIENLRIKTPGVEQCVKYLSGGNQQKVIIAKWLSRKAKLLIFDEPTRGIDVGAKFEIYKLMNSLSDQGIGIIMISSELPEVLGMSDRVVVFQNGRITGELDIKDATQEKILEYATGMRSVVAEEEKNEIHK